MDFVPHDENTIRNMLKTIGIGSLEDLFQDVPSDLKIKTLNIPPGLSEADLFRLLEEISNKNQVYPTSFLGAGCYYHYIPSLVDFVISRSEFYTSYTPYQAEASQGYLQAIFEYQSAITKITEMDVANASMYDGATALAEAAIMASAITGKNKILLLDGIHPEYLEVVKTYCWGHDILYQTISQDQLLNTNDDEISAILFQSPNFFGDIEDVDYLVKKIRQKFPKALVIQLMTDPTCLGLIKPPGSTDIDIFVAEGQSFGLSPSFGGPGLGIFTTKKKYLRKIPGRLIGKTMELNGDKEGFILTLQAREQHIRREKALSNICTNQSLCSLAALIYLVSLGKTGLIEVAKQNFQKADHVKKIISSIPGYRILNEKPTYNEFLVECPNIDGLLDSCKQKNILPPLKVSKYFPEMENIALVCVTELNSCSDIERFLKIVQSSTSQREGGK